MFSEPVQPAFEISIPLPPGSAWMPVAASFDPASSRLLVHYSVPSTTPGNWWRYHAPDIAAPFLLLFALIFVFSLRGILRRPQLSGHLYCRACNYDLTLRSLAAEQLIPDEHAPAALSLCPECGTSTHKRRPAEGLPLLRRLLPFIGIFIPLLLIPSLILISRLEFKTRDNTSWPLEALDQISWWPIARPLVPPHQSRHFEIYTLPAGVQTSHTVIEDDPWNGKLTRDLTHYAYSRFSEENGWENQACIFEPTTGRIRTYNLGGSSAGFSAFHGYTPDEKEAICTLISLVGPENLCTARILCVDVETLKVREVAQVKVTPQSTGPNNWQLPSLSASVCNSPPRWSFLIVSGPQAGKLNFGPLKSGAIGESTLSITPATSFSPRSVLSYNADGTLLYDESLELVPETGQVRAMPKVAAMHASLAGNSLSVFSGDTFLQSFPIDPAITSCASPPVISRDGRWLFLAANIASTSPAAPRTKYLVFDLTRPQPNTNAPAR